MKFSLTFLFMAFIFTSPLKSEDLPFDFTVRQKSFILELYVKGDHFQCIAETRRLLDYAGGTANPGGYELFILGNYFMGKQYKTVIYHLTGERKSVTFKERLLLSQSYMRLGYFDMGYKSVKDLTYDGNRDATGYEILLRKIEPLLLGYDFEAAAAVLNEAKPHVIDDRYALLYRSLMSYDRRGYKSAPAAVALSVILPGAGQVYSGSIMSGMISFLGVAVTASAAYYFMRKGDRGLGYSFTFFSSLFYAGGAYGAYNTSEKYNRDRDRNFVRDTRNRHIPAYTPVSPGDLTELFN